jgi:type IV pilus assembly protein PilC
MPSFSYTATHPSGGVAKGTHKAVSREAAELALYEQELRNIRVVEKTSILKTEITPTRVKRQEVMHLSRQLGAFIAAGLPLVDAVRLIGSESSNRTVRRLMSDTEVGLRGGDTPSDCFDRYPRVFPEYYRGILRSAELTGRLDTVLKQLAEYLERDLAVRRKVKSASIYPAVIAAMSVVVIVVLAVFVMPRFETFFASLDAKLPLPTRMLLATTGFIGTYWWAIVGGAAGLFFLLFAGTRAESGKYAWHKLLLKVPVVGETIRFVMVERFARILAAMVGAGVSLPEALRVSTQSLRNRVFMRALGGVGESMFRGEGLARPLTATGLFPATATQMIRVGEETGTLDNQLDTTADYYEGELRYKIERLTALFEPIVILVMGVIVGFVAIALVSAMYGVYSQVEI